MEYFFVLLGVMLAFVFVGAGLLVSRLVAPHRPGFYKNSPYECGEEQIGSAWIQFNVGYYLFALLFVVFELEAAFLFPWAVVFKEVGWIAFFEAGLFILILLFALVYAWRKGVLEWE